MKDNENPKLIRKAFKETTSDMLRGYCPMCGSSKVNAYSEDTERLCGCEDCGFRWHIQYRVDCFWVPSINETFEVEE